MSCKPKEADGEVRISDLIKYFKGLSLAKRLQLFEVCTAIKLIYM